MARRTRTPGAVLGAILALGVLLLWTSAARADFTYQTQFGTSGPGLLSNPFGTAVSADGNSVYVGDQQHNRVVQFSRSGSFIRAWGTLGTAHDQFEGLDGLAVDHAGNVYTAECQNSRVQKFAPDGTFLAAFGKNGGDGSSGTGDGEFHCVIGVAIDSSGNIVVPDADNDRVQVLSPSGSFLTKFGSTGTAQGQLSDPEGVATDIFGDAYVVECNNHRISEFTEAGTFIRAWGGLGTGDGQLSCPESASVDPQGRVWVGDEGNNRIQEFAPDGTFLAKFGKNGGNGTSGTGNGEFNEAEQIGFDCRSNAFVADYGNNREQAFGLPGLPAPNCLAPSVSAGAPSALPTSVTLNATIGNDSQLAVYHFEFGPTSAYGLSTAPQTLAASASPVPVSANFASLAPSTPYHYRIIATTFSGTTVTADQTVVTAGVRAVVSSAGQSARRWREPRKPRSPRISRRVPTGTTFRFSLSAAGNVRFTFARRVAGRKVGKKCSPPSRRTRHKPRCTRSVPSGSFSFAGHAGLNKVRFQGRISRTKKLKPGNYRLTIRATSPGAAPSSTKLSFTIVK